MPWKNYGPRNKYGSKKVEIDGIVFDSKREAKRWTELKLLERTGHISELRRQVEYVLIPEQREWTNEIYQKGRNKGCFKKGKLLERKCSYFADFVYLDSVGRISVEDTKGMRTKDYIIKRKLMLHVFGIKIKEI